jgi:hypothetical protein
LFGRELFQMSSEVGLRPTLQDVVNLGTTDADPIGDVVDVRDTCVTPVVRDIKVDRAFHAVA